jgi:aspartyl-tRNA(Asn)/glutamyl-tRNA(Gln) amidotransferase subunit C
MTKKIDREQVKKVAHLARLEITPQEEMELEGSLNAILDYFEQLEELDTTDVPPTTRAIDISNITRIDQLIPWDDRDELLSEAPDQDGDFYKVPQIMGGDPS